MCQTEVGLQFALAKREQLGDGALTDGDRRHLARADGIRVDAVPTYAAPVRDFPTGSGDDLDQTRARLAERGYTAMTVRLQRSDVPVVKVVCPDLQLMPSQILIPRVSQSSAEYGGSSFWTGGLPLF